MSKLDLSPAAPKVSDAASFEHTTRDKWVQGGKALAKCGLTSIMLVKSTEKHPNDAFDADALAQVRGFIIQGLSASKKGLTFSTPVPGSINAENPKGSMKWTVADLLALTRDQLRDIDDDILKNVRRTYMQLVDGPMLSRVREYVDRANGVERTRERKAETKAETPAAGDPIQIIQDWINQGPLMVSAADVDEFVDAGLTMIALLRKHRGK